MIRPIILIHLMLFTSTCFNLNAQETYDFDKVNSAIYNERYYVADRLIDSIEQAYPNNAEVYYLKAHVQRKTYHTKEAYHTINKALKIDNNNNPKLLKEYGKICIAYKKLDQAIEVFDTLFFYLDTSNYSMGILLGKCLLKQKQWKAALPVYLKMQRFDTSNTYYLYKTSLCLANTKRGLEAIPHLTKLVKIDPNHTAAYQLLYKIYIAKKDREKALYQINQLKRIEPNNYEHYTEAAYFHMTKNHIFLANDNFEKAIELGDPEPVSRWDNARCLYQMKFYNEAIIFFSMMEDQNTRFHDFTMLADCYQKTNRSKTAVEYYNKALVLAIPSAFELSNIFSGKADVLIGQGKYEDAIKIYQEALGHYKGISSGASAKSMALREMVDIYQNQLHQPEKAIELYQHLLSEVSEYSNPQEVNYYKQEITRLNEEVFFKGN